MIIKVDTKLINVAVIGILYSNSGFTGMPTASPGSSGGVGEGMVDKAYIDGFPYSYCQMNEASISAEDCTKVSIPDSSDLPEVGKLTQYQVTEAINFEGSNVQALGWRQGFGDWRIPTKSELEYMNSKNYLNDSFYYLYKSEGDDATMIYQPFSPVGNDVSDVTSSSLVYAPAYIRDGIEGDGSGSNEPSLLCGYEQGNPFSTDIGGGINDSARIAHTACIKVMENNAKTKWFTSSPSEAVLEKLGYSVRNENSPDTYYGVKKEELPYYHATVTWGNFGLFSMNSKKHTINDNINGTVDLEWVGGQADRWCKKLSSIKLAGKSDWRLPTRQELIDFYYGSKDGSHTFRTRFGAPASTRFWTRDYAPITNYPQPTGMYVQGMLGDSQDNISSVTLNLIEGRFVSCITER